MVRPVVIDLTGDSPPPAAARGRKRAAGNVPAQSVGVKRARTAAHSTAPRSAQAAASEVGEGSKANGGERSKRKAKKSSPNEDGEPAEKRLKAYRAKEPQAYLELKARALSQRMFMINRTRDGTLEEPKEVITIAGTTGNLYKVTIDRKPTCDCPHFEKGHPQCKHIIYALIRVLKASPEIARQLALLHSELRTLFAGAPPIIDYDALTKGERAAEKNQPEEQDTNRKPIEGDCPICFSEFEPAEKTVYCKAACGNNFHAQCFSQWKAQKRAAGTKVTCPLCRSGWEGEVGATGKGDMDSVRIMAGASAVNEEGYVNVASQLGLSGQRDYSTYHQPWVSRERRGYGYGRW